MKPIERERTTALFELAIKLPLEDQGRFLERECCGDEALLVELTSLLAEYRESGASAGDPQPAPDASPMPRRIGRYEVTGEIGSGGFGHVYSALDQKVGRVVAIKVLNAPGDRDLVKRFRAEALTVANLHHKNIVTVHEFGEENGAPYLVMEFLEGTTVQDLIRQRTPLSLQEKLWIMSEVAEALQCAHDRGVIHRDVKPANIMRLSDGSVKLMDFGIARIARESTARLTQSGLVIGTLKYMAPEQFSGTADALSDIFAYGVTFYELLTGRHPFASTDPAVIMYRIVNADPEALRSLLPECPESVERIVNRTLAKSREVRYSSLADVAADTKPILLDLRRHQAVELFSQAEQFLRGGQLDTAQSAVRKALELDPWHAEARQLRSRIEQALRRRDLVDRAGDLLDRAERALGHRDLNEAAECLASVKQLSVSDPRIDARLERAYQQIEQARNALQLLDVARENLHREDLSEAFRAVSEVLVSDPGNGTGQQLLQEIQTRMTAREAQRRIQEEIARAQSLLSIGEIDQALALLADIETRAPSHKELPALRARAAAQKAEQERTRRLTGGIAAVKALLKDRQFDSAVGSIDGLLTEFTGNAELMALRRHAAEQVAAGRRAEEIQHLRAEAAASIERREYDRAIRAVEAGVARLGDDGDLIRLLQAAVAKKAAQEREQAVSRIKEDAERFRRQGKLDDALRAIERALQTWGNDPPLLQLRQEISDELREKERRHRIRDVLRRANELIDQKKADAAIILLRQSIERDNGDPELTTLLQTAESQIQDREARLPIDEGPKEVPHEPPLVSDVPPSLAIGQDDRSSLFASIRDLVARWITVPIAAVLAVIALIAGFWLFQPTHDARSLQLHASIQKAIQDRNWTEAERLMSAYAGTKPQDYPRVVNMRHQIEQGKQLEISGLEYAIYRDIAARQWSRAGTKIARFEHLAPGDPRATEWRKQVDAGIASDQNLGNLRASIQNAIRQKDWPKAEAQIASLLAKAPGDPQAAEWRALVYQGRRSELLSNNTTKLKEQQETELARAEQLLQQGDYPAAIELFQHVLKQDPGNARARRGLKQATDAKATEDRVLGTVRL